MRPCETFMRLCTVPGQGLQISPASFSSDLREDVFPLELSSLQSAVPRSLRPQPQGSSLDARSLENLYFTLRSLEAQRWPRLWLRERLR